MITATLKSGIDEDVCIQLRPLNQKGAYLCDCGAARDLTIKDCRETLAIFVTHTHIDHFANFDGIMRHQLAIGRGVVVCGPKGIARQVHHKLAAYTWNLSFDDAAVFYEVREIEEEGRIAVYELRVPAWEPLRTATLEGETIYSDAAVSVRYGVLDHGTPSIAYLFAEPSRLKLRETPYPPGPWIGALKAAWTEGQPEAEVNVHGELKRAGELFGLLYEEAGYRVGVAMDHAGHEENHRRIAALCQGADQLFIECYYADRDVALADANAHSTATRSGLAAKKAGVREVVPVHFSRRYNAEVEALQAACLEAFQG